MSRHSICEYFLFMIDWFFRGTICLWQYPLYTVMVFDDWRNGIPIVYLVISCTQEHGLILVLQSLHDRVTRLRENWHPSSIVVDNAHAEINTRYSLIFFIWWLCFQSCPSASGFLLFLACAGLCGPMPKSSCVFGTFGKLRRRTLLKNLYGWRTCHDVWCNPWVVPLQLGWRRLTVRHHVNLYSLKDYRVSLICSVSN